MIGGYVSSGFLAAAGLAGVAIPQRVASALDTPLPSGRARAEFRVANGGFAGVGIWAVIVGTPTAFAAVGAMWIGAGATRLLAVPIDTPRLDWTYWAYLALEAVLGTLAFISA